MSETRYMLVRDAELYDKEEDAHAAAQSFRPPAGVLAVTVPDPRPEEEDVAREDQEREEEERVLARIQARKDKAKAEKAAKTAEKRDEKKDEKVEPKE